MAGHRTLNDSSEKARILVCAFANVPGPSAVGVRAEQILLAFSDDVDLDALTLKANNLTHIQRVAQARMLRVPVPDLVSGEATAARGPFLERLSTFKRALQRQLEGEQYNALICLDLFAAAAAAPLLDRSTRLMIEVGDVPSTTFERRWPVDPKDGDTRKKWEAAEHAALKLASVVMVPSRQATRLVADITDPRTLRVVPRLVDTRVFQPSSVEVALDDVKTVAFLGGREGGSRALAVTAAIRSLLQRAPDCRVLVLGTPSRAERLLVDELMRRSLMERVVPVDVATPSELAQALSAAHVVVVPAGADGDVYGIPHRALEAMACGRAVVVTGAEATYKEVITNGVNGRVVVPNAPDEVAAAVAELLNNDTQRNTLARNALKQAQKFDLAARLGDLAAAVSDGVGVELKGALPPLDDVTAPAPVARAVPAVAPVRTKPLASPPPTLTVPTASPVPQRSQRSQASLKSQLPSPAAKKTKPKNPTTKNASAKPSTKTLEPLVSAELPSSGDVWAGDTLLDPHALLPSPSDPAPDKVKGAMLVTTSGAAARATSSKAEATAEATGPRRAAGGPRSLQLAMADDDGDDDWSRDTIADASPVVPDVTRQPMSTERPPQTHPARSLLVEHAADLTAEDHSHTSSSSSDD